MDIHTICCKRHISSYIIVDRETSFGALIDAPDFESIKNELNQLHPIPKITKIFLTHSHYDHSLGVVDFIPELIRRAELQIEDEKCKDISIYIGKAEVESFSSKFPSSILKHLSAIDEHSIITIGSGIEVRPIPTPAHSEGHMCFHCIPIHSNIDSFSSHNQHFITSSCFESFSDSASTSSASPFSFAPYLTSTASPTSFSTPSQQSLLLPQPPTSVVFSGESLLSGGGIGDFKMDKAEQAFSDLQALKKLSEQFQNAQLFSGRDETINFLSWAKYYLEQEQATCIKLGSALPPQQENILSYINSSLDSKSGETKQTHNSLLRDEISHSLFCQAKNLEEFCKLCTSLKSYFELTREEHIHLLCE